MKQRVYLDTSVVSAFDDTRAPDRQRLTQEFFARVSDFDVCCSELTRHEVLETESFERQQRMLELISGLPVIPITPQARDLAQRYMIERVFPRGAVKDSLHVAIAVTSRQDALVSWNFKHLVNQRKRAAIDAFNLRLGMPRVSILAPPEL